MTSNQEEPTLRTCPHQVTISIKHPTLGWRTVKVIWPSGTSEAQMVTYIQQSLPGIIGARITREYDWSAQAKNSEVVEVPLSVP
jgi:hypothetical protein